MSCLRWVGIAAVIGMAAGQAAAQDYTYEWYKADTGNRVTGSSVDVPVGSIVTLQVYIRERVGGTVLGTQGLFSAGVRATYDPAVALVPDLSSISGNTGSGGFNDPAEFQRRLGNPNTYAEFEVAVTDPFAGVRPAADNQVLLGTFTFRADGQVGSSAVVTALDIPGTQDTLTGFSGSPPSGGMELDGLIQSGQVTIHVVPVPEPATALVIGAAGVAVFGGVRRARRGRTSPVAVP